MLSLVLWGLGVSRVDGRSQDIGFRGLGFKGLGFRGVGFRGFGFR